MFQKIAVANPFRKPTALQLVQDELQEAERQLVNYQSVVEYAKAQVDYNQQRITRLRSQAQKGSVL